MGIRILVIKDEPPIADFLVRGLLGSLPVRNWLGHGSCFRLRFPTLLTAHLLIPENS
ncbi:MAG TPA: hypothetical protein VMG10_36715 [Gemmataceae bacterium]|nr:hypothetical protein [Gemmataceae bacterium]